jgi:hypothetical protein
MRDRRDSHNDFSILCLGRQHHGAGSGFHAFLQPAVVLVPPQICA